MIEYKLSCNCYIIENKIGGRFMNNYFMREGNHIEADFIIDKIVEYNLSKSTISYKALIQVHIFS